jgi:hypothetical protein
MAHNLGASPLRRHSWFRRWFVPTAVGLILLWNAGVAVVGVADPCSQYSITFLEATFDGTDTTFRYQVCSNGSPAISHWVIGFDSCATCSDLVGASHAYTCGTDPTTGLFGVKFDQGFSSSECREYWIKLSGGWSTELVNAAVKAGPGQCDYMVEGPGCPVVVDYTLTILYEYEDGTTAAATYIETLNVDDAYSVSSPELAGYTADQLVVAGTMPAADVTETVVYTPIDYTLTILYEYEDGSEAAPPYITFVNEGEEFGVESPGIEGFTPDQTVVTGTMPPGDVTVTVIYAGTEGGGGGAAEECAGLVIISEIAWAGTAVDRDHQWIELRNLGSEPVDVTGWTLRWRKKEPVVPEDYEWKVLPLSGVLEGAYTTACEWNEREFEEPTVEFLRREVDELSWGGRDSMERRRELPLDSAQERSGDQQY